MKKIPKLKGLTIDYKEMYNSKREEIKRAGIKVNTPIACNWACPYCYAGSEEFKNEPQVSGEYTWPYKDEEWHTKMFGWIDTLIKKGLSAVTINGTFEPLTSPKLKEVINYCVKKNLTITLVTNGMLLTDEIIDFLYIKGVSILTKLNVPFIIKTEKNYEEVCNVYKKMSGLKGDASILYEQHKKTIDKLVQRGFNNGENGQTRLGIESVISKINLKYLPKLLRQCRTKNIYTHLEVIKLQGYGKNHKELQVTTRELEDLFLLIQKEDLAENYEVWDAKPPYIAGTCYENLLRVDVSATGEVYPCPGIDYKLGDLKKNSLSEILTNEKLEIIRNLDKYIEGDCKECSLFLNKECYAGCRGTAYQTLRSLGYSIEQSLKASDPSCWKVKNILNGVKNETEWQR